MDELAGSSAKKPEENPEEGSGVIFEEKKKHETPLLDDFMKNLTGLKRPEQEEG